MNTHSTHFLYMKIIYLKKVEGTTQDSAFPARLKIQKFLCSHSLIYTKSHLDVGKIHF